MTATPVPVRAFMVAPMREAIGSCMSNAVRICAQAVINRVHDRTNDPVSFAVHDAVTEELTHE